MIFSLIMHALIGYFGTGIFIFTPTGIALAVGIAIATQGVDVIRVKKLYIMKTKGKYEKEVLKQHLIKSFVRNTAYCSALTIFVAEFSRANNMGL